jgi:LysM repeat protein
MYQTVSVAPGTNLTAEASSYLISCTLDDDDEFGKCASDPASGAQTRVGIDPDGGSDPNAPEIIWSGWASGHDFWANMQTQATATGGSATIFLYMTQATVQQNNFAYWDNAKLYAGGEGGAAPAAVNDTTTASTTDITGTSAIAPVATPFPTVAPRPRVQYAPFVVPQADTNTDEEQVEITHTVQTGDTFDAIAYAYGLTRDDLLEINPNIGSIRFLRIGQTIIVQPASTPEVTATEEAPVATEEPATPAG